MPAAADLSVSVIVCAYTDERLDQLRGALKSLFQQSVPPTEIIVAFDHNPALLHQISVEFPEITVVPNEGARGLSATRNVGVERASGRILAFLDDDAAADRQWIARMQSCYADPDVVAAGGTSLPKWPKERPRWFPEEFDWVIGCSYRGRPEHVTAVRNLWGGNVSMRRELFEQVEGFNESIGRQGNNATGGEETEFFIRVHQSLPQCKVIYDPEILIHHHVPPERTRWRYFRSRCIAEGRSKAQIVDNVGIRDGLSDERRYAIRILPAGVIRGLGDAIGRRDLWGLARASAIVAGLAYAARGYFGARWSQQAKSLAVEKSFLPIKILDLDISRPLPTIEARNPDTGRPYGGAFCLLRRDGKPVKVVELPRQATDLSPARLKELLNGEVKSPSHARRARTSLSTVLPFSSVVVATRDRPAGLAVCLDSLMNQDCQHFEIIVVDSAPTSSETAELIAGRYAATGRVRYIRENRPGLGRAHNRGLEGISGAVVAFTDDDVIVDRRWLSVLAANFSAGDAVGCVTGLILPAQLETRAQIWTERHGSFGKGFQRKVYDLGEHRPPGALFPFTAGQFGSGANMAFLTEALRRVGGFDSALGAGTPARGGDDLAAFFAVIRAGYQLVYEPEAIVWHHHRRSEDGMRRQAFGYGVGLGAYLTKAVVDEPKLAFELMRVLPAGIAHMWGKSSSRMRRLPGDYPKGLIWRERLGVLAGPPAYVRSLLAGRRDRRSAAARRAEISRRKDERAADSQRRHLVMSRESDSQRH